MWWIVNVMMPIAGGLIAASGFIVKKVPNAQDVLNKLLPYKGMIGVAMLASFVLNMLDLNFNPFAMLDFSALLGITVIGLLATQLILGFTMGFGLIAKWIPGESAPEEKAAEIQKKLIPYEVPVGLLAIASGILMLLFRMKPEMFF